MASTRHAADKRTRSLNNMPADDDENERNDDGFSVVKTKRRRRGQQQKQRSRQPNKASAQDKQLMQKHLKVGGFIVGATVRGGWERLWRFSTQLREGP